MNIGSFIQTDALIVPTLGMSTGLQYGNLVDLHPLESYLQIKARREANFTILKNLLESGEFTMKADRLEISIIHGQTISGDDIILRGVDRDTSQLIVWPFVPGNRSVDTLITPDYGDTITVSDITIKTPQKNNFHENYSCVLKYGGTANAIKILGTVRDGFWADMTIGKTIYYQWTWAVLGESKVINSIDEANSIIYTTTNLSASVTSDMQGADVNFGTAFRDDIPEEDYATYGKMWIVTSDFASNLINSNAVSSIADITVNLNTIRFENFGTMVGISAKAWKMNFTNVQFYRGNVPVSGFVQSTAGGQTLTSYGEYLVEEAGDICGGAVASLEPSGNYGLGTYLHDSVIVKLYGQLHLKNNVSAAWKQYSSSYGPDTGGFSYFADILEEGSDNEYGMLTSNTMPTVIDNLVSSGQILLRHSTTINGGTIGQISVQGTDYSVTPTTGVFTDITFTGIGVVLMHFFDTVTLTDCTFTIPLSSYLYPSASLFVPAKTTSIIGGTLIKGSGVGTIDPATGAITGSAGIPFSAINSTYFNESNFTIDGLIWNEYIYHYLFTDASSQTPYIEKDYNIQLKNLDVKAYFLLDGYSTAGTVSNNMTGTNVVLRFSYNQHAGEGLLQNISGKTGTISKTIVPSKSLGKIGVVANVLEVDWEHDQYQTHGTLNAIFATESFSGSYSGNTLYGKNIRVYAVGGNITLSTFDATLRPTSNIIGANGTVIFEGNYLDFTINRGKVFMTGTAATNETVATGNGVLTGFKGVLSKYILDPDATISVIAGAVNVDADSNGVFSDAAVVGIVDKYTGKFQFIFTDPVTDTVPIKVYYSYPNTWKSTGGWTI